jgi:hypothetical protein
MEQFPPGAWELGRPNLIEWARDLTTAPPSKGINAARDRLFELGRRVDKMMRVIMYDDEFDPDDEEAKEGDSEEPGPYAGTEEDPVTEEKGEEKEEPALIENETAVFFFVFISLYSS